MTKKETNEVYPVRTLHEFIDEINREWGRFKKGALISISISSLLLVAFALVFVRTILRTMEISDIILELVLAAFLVYSIYLMNHQYRFFRKWEKRMKRLTTLEEKLMPEKAEEALADKP
jgi:membrane protein implicated in regulation of membrane protease activity